MNCSQKRVGRSWRSPPPCRRRSRSGISVQHSTKIDGKREQLQQAGSRSPTSQRSNQFLWVKIWGPGNRRLWVGWYIIYYFVYLMLFFFGRFELPMIFGNFNGLWVPQRWPLSDSVFGHGLSLERSVPSMIRWRENPEELHIWCLSLLCVFL